MEQTKVHYEKTLAGSHQFILYFIPMQKKIRSPDNELDRRVRLFERRQLSDDAVTTTTTSFVAGK